MTSIDMNATSKLNSMLGTGNIAKSDPETSKRGIQGEDCFERAFNDVPCTKREVCDVNGCN